MSSYGLQAAPASYTCSNYFDHLAISDIPLTYLDKLEFNGYMKRIRVT